MHVMRAWRSGECAAVAVTVLTLVAASVACGRDRDATGGERNAAPPPSELDRPVEPTPADLRGGPRGEGAGAVIDRAGFWAIIDEVRGGAADDEVFLERFAARLRALSPGELVSIQRELHAVHDESYGWPLWGACYLVHGGCSDDAFEYFRAWLIAQGRTRFERAVTDPDTLADMKDPRGELEQLLAVAPAIYRARTGQEMPEEAWEPGKRPDLDVDPASPVVGSGDAWDFDDSFEMAKRYPRLHARFGR